MGIEEGTVLRSFGERRGGAATAGAEEGPCVGLLLEGRGGALATEGPEQWLAIGLVGEGSGSAFAAVDAAEGLFVSVPRDL